MDFGYQTTSSQAKKCFKNAETENCFAVPEAVTVSEFFSGLITDFNDFVEYAG